jgi:signal transduction histidine kinase
VAIAFQPVLRRARHVANRLVYGDRATPYEVLSEFSERMGEAYATDDLPQRMTRILAEGTGATTASVWLHVGNELRPASTWPADAPTPPPAIAPADGDVTIPGAGQTFAVRHQGELLGALSVVMPPEEPLATEQENLCTGLASQAGLVLRNVRLIEELRASRQRLVTAQDQERRKLERNLHDGAQQQLVALAVKGRLVSTLLERDLARARALLDEIQTETTDALETLRDLARGIYPPLLADQGLPAALEAQVRKAPLPVEVSADGLGRYAPEVEAAVYFCCLEAVQNVSKYANASSASVELRVDTTDLTFVVHDDGVGFDIAQTVMGTGIQGIADRLAALGGRLDIDSAPGAGTSLRGRIPVG